MTEHQNIHDGLPKPTHPLRLRHALCAVTLMLSSCSQADLSETRDLGSFRAIGIGDGFDVVIRQGEHAQVTVRSDLGDTGEAETVIEGDKLVLRKTSHWFWMFNVMHWFSEYSVEITVPALDRVAVAGGSHVRIDGDFNARALELATSGGSNLLFKGKAESLDLKTSGGSSVALEGSATTMTARTSGGSTVRGMNFEVDDADVNSSGGSSFSITAHHKLTARASGGSAVRYGGHPQDTDVHASGGADIHER